MMTIKKIQKQYDKLLKKKVPLYWLLLASLLVTLLLAILIVTLCSLHRAHQSMNARQSAPYEANAPLLEKVRAQTPLPDEIPTVATVTNPSKLSGQPFFRDAIAGDKVIIYSVAGEAILYRPSTGKVIVTAPFSKVSL